MRDAISDSLWYLRSRWTIKVDYWQTTLLARKRRELSTYDFDIFTG
jgi:hypothetical protein